MSLLGLNTSSCYVVTCYKDVKTHYSMDSVGGCPLPLPRVRRHLSHWQRTETRAALTEPPDGGDIS